MCNLKPFTPTEFLLVPLIIVIHIRIPSNKFKIKNTPQIEIIGSRWATFPIKWQNLHFTCKNANLSKNIAFENNNLLYIL